MNETGGDRSCKDKIAFATEKEARAAATLAKWRYETAQAGFKTYRCAQCRLLHLARRV